MKFFKIWVLRDFQPDRTQEFQNLLRERFPDLSGLLPDLRLEIPSRIEDDPHFLSQGKEKQHINTNKFGRSSRDWVGGKHLFTCFFGGSHTMDKKSAQSNSLDSPGNFPEKSVFVFVSSVFFSLPTLVHVEEGTASGNMERFSIDGRCVCERCRPMVEETRTHTHTHTHTHMHARTRVPQMTSGLAIYAARGLQTLKTFSTLIKEIDAFPLN